MRTIEDGNLIIYAPDEAIYTKEANTIRVISTIENITYITMQIDASIPDIGGLSADYVLSAGEAEIDMTDIVAIAQANNNTPFALTFTTIAGDSVEVVFSIVGEGRPFVYPYPTHINSAFSQLIRQGAGMGGLIIPPSVIIEPIAGVNLSIPVVFRAIAEFSDPLLVYEPQTEVRIATTTEAGGYIIRDTDDNEIYRIPYQARECGVDYCALKWADRVTGLQKCFIFEMSASTYTTTVETPLMRLDRGYITHKNSAGSFIARLRNVSRYDTLYYSDLIGAEVVECTTDGQTWRKVYIDTDTISAQDGDAERTDFEVNVNIIRYEN